MSSKGKYIGISNRIPIIVLECAISHFVSTGKVDSAQYLKFVREYTKGDNRAKKTLTHITTIINKNASLLNLISKQCKGDYSSFSSNDQKSILLCLYALAFPIAYDILQGFAVGFKVQEIISKRVILEKIGSIYGSNRAMHIGVDETLPFIIDGGLIERFKIGIYKKCNPIKILSPVATELAIYTDLKLSSTKSILVDDLVYKPWYGYFEFTNIIPENFNILISLKDSAIGKGYLTIK
jgi:hypothetical protein